MQQYEAILKYLKLFNICVLSCYIFQPKQTFQPTSWTASITCPKGHFDGFKNFFLCMLFKISILVIRVRFNLQALKCLLTDLSLNKNYSLGLWLWIHLFHYLHVNIICTKESYALLCLNTIYFITNYFWLILWLYLFLYIFL